MCLPLFIIFKSLTAYRANLSILRPRLDVDNLPLMIFVNKGIEIGTYALTLEIIADTCGPDIAKAATFIVGLKFFSLLQILIFIFF